MQNMLRTLCYQPTTKHLLEPQSFHISRRVRTNCRSSLDLLDDYPADTDQIDCVHSKVASIPALDLTRFTKVERLCLRQNSISKISGLSPLAATLTELDLYDNIIVHMPTALEELKALIVLDLSFNKIKHIQNLEGQDSPQNNNELTKKYAAGLTEIKDLYLLQNKISVIENVSKLPKLKNLELGANRIRAIENLDGLNLEELYLGKNKITQITGLTSPSLAMSLTILDLKSNRIRNFGDGLKALTNLEELYISHNALESLSGLENNLKLRTLDISNNKIDSLAGLGPHAELEELWASYNQIGDFREVERELADKKNLTTVYFEGNPLQLRQPALYRNKVKLALPQLKQIDASTSTPLWWLPKNPSLPVKCLLTSLYSLLAGVIWALVSMEGVRRGGKESHCIIGGVSGEHQSCLSGSCSSMKVSRTCTALQQIYRSSLFDKLQVRGSL
jgi:protein phosphatase 1 regulatory subunit 7